MSLLRLWLWSTGLLIAFWLIYVFAPILIPFIVLTLLLAVLTRFIVLATRIFERWWVARKGRG